MSLRALFGRGTWSLASQLLNTAANLGLAVFVARESTPSQYGAWAIAYISFIVSIAIHRAIITTPLLLERPDKAQLEKPEIGALGASLGLGTVSSLAVFGVGLSLSGQLRTAFFSFAFTLALVLFHDAMRYVHFGRRSPRGAAALDAVRTVSQLACFLWLVGTGYSDVTTLTLAWGLSAGLPAFVYAIGMRLKPGFQAALAHFHARPHMLVRLFLDAAFTSLAANLITLIIAAFLTLQDAGYFRAAQTLMGGVGLVVSGLMPLLTVESVDRLRRGVKPMRIVLVWSILIASGSGAYGLVVLLMPDRWGYLIVGDSFSGAAIILPALVLQAVLRGPFTGVPALLKAQTRFGELVKLRVWISLITVASPTIGVSIGGLGGAAWGLVVAAVAVDVVCLSMLFRKGANPQTS